MATPVLLIRGVLMEPIFFFFFFFQKKRKEKGKIRIVAGLMIGSGHCLTDRRGGQRMLTDYC
jgi:hypothetical protein